MDAEILGSLAPVILLLALGVVAAIGSRLGRLSPIVGYIVLGIALKAFDISIVADSGTVQLLSELGVVFLLFDIGLHFSLAKIRHEASDIFGFGPVQVLFGAILLGLIALATGVPVLPAFLLGTVLALSSTAAVAPVIAERHQQNCPVGLTSTAILIFQDVAAIFLLIVAGALDGGSVLPLAGLALAKAAGAFLVAVLAARFVVKPLFAMVARGRQEEVFTAMALFVALGAGWLTGHIGLSLTLGAFLGGMTISETPYRAIIQSEIKPFRGLLLGFFFISVGLSLDLDALIRDWPVVIAVALGMIVAKVASNAAASIVFRWSVPGSLQLGFLLAQGSEFAFVILAMPAFRNLLGPERVAIVATAVALSIALTPTLATLGRTLAGKLRMRAAKPVDRELQRREEAAPVLIVGMGRTGRTLADALRAFNIEYSTVERDQRRLSEALADGYSVVYGDTADPRLWDAVSLEGRKIIALTAPSYEVSHDVAPIIRGRYPDLLRFAVVEDDADVQRFHAVGVRAVPDRGVPRGLDLATAVLIELGVDPDELIEWAQRQRRRAMGDAGAILVDA